MIRSAYRSIFFSTLLLGWQPIAHASSVQYHPDSQARLGFGFDPQAVEKIYAIPCIRYEGSENIDTTGDGVVESSVDISEVSDRRSLLDTVGISASVEAQAGLFSGSTTFSKNVAVTFESTSLTWVASAKVNFGRWRLVNPQPTQALIDAATPADVLRICGAEIFTQETRGATASVVFEVRGVTSQQKQELSAALSVAKTGPGPSGSADLKFRSVLEKIENTSQLRVYTQIQGGPGRAALASILDSPSDLSNIRAALSKYIQETTPANAKPLGFQTTPVTQFKSVQISTPPNLQQDRLWDIYQQYINITGIIQRINELIKPTAETEDFLRIFVKDSKRAELSATRMKYEQARTSLRNAGLNCLRSADACEVPSLAELPRLIWPEIPPAPYVAGVERCETSLLFTVGSPPPAKGSTVGFAFYKLALMGDKRLFDSIWLIASDGSTPLRVLDPNPQDDPIHSLQLFGETCDRRPIDETKVFGWLRISVDLKHDLPVSSRIEVREKFGRRTFYELGPAW